MLIVHNLVHTIQGAFSNLSQLFQGKNALGNVDDDVSLTLHNPSIPLTQLP